MNKILILGGINMDETIRVVAMPKVGETINGHDLTFSPGGKGANQAFAAAKLGAKVKMLGAVGCDTFGEAICKNLSSVGIDLSDLYRDEKEPTGTALITVDDRGNNSIIVAQGANLRYRPEMINDALFNDVSMVIMPLEVPMDAIEIFIKRAYELGKTVIVNPAPAPEGSIAHLYPMISWLTPNETELEKMSGMNCDSLDSIVAAAEKLLNAGVKNLLITAGSRGSVWVSKEKAVLFPTRTVKAVDTTAAGDTFHGGFCTKLAEGASVEEAIFFGNFAASIGVTRPGAQASVPSREEVEAILSEMPKAVILK